MQVVRVLGVDPGSRLTGYGCVDVVGNQIRHVTHGVFRLSNTGGRAVVPLEQRLLLLHEGLCRVIQEFRPQIMSIERVFFAKNAVSALKLGQARGAAILSGAIHQLQIVEYSPTQVKAAIAGSGQADKEQVARMLKMIFGKQEFKTFDASDGLALAVCHAQQIAGRGGVDPLLAASARRGRRASSLADAIGLTEEMASGKKSVRADVRREEAK